MRTTFRSSTRSRSGRALPGRTSPRPPPGHPGRTTGGRPARTDEPADQHLDPLRRERHAPPRAPPARPRTRQGGRVRDHPAPDHTLGLEARLARTLHRHPGSLPTEHRRYPSPRRLLTGSAVSARDSPDRAPDRLGPIVLFAYALDSAAESLAAAVVTTSNLPPLAGQTASSSTDEASSKSNCNDTFHSGRSLASVSQVNSRLISSYW